MKCLWCENPESIHPWPQLSFHKNKCIACGECQKACPQGAIDLKSDRRIDRSRCDDCGICVQNCYAEALEMIGREVSVEEILEEVKKDEAFYKRSGGGVTISGGESTMQYNFLMELLKALKRENIHVVLETNGFIKWEKLAPLTGFVDIFYQDIKGIEPKTHQKYTGVGNDLILSNARGLLNNGNKVVFRVPLIPGVNDTPEQLSLLNGFFTETGAEDIQLLPYHKFGEDKLDGIHTRQQPLSISAMDHARVEEIKNVLQHPNRNITIGGT